MARKKIYGKKRKIKLIPLIIILVIALAVFLIIWGGSKLFSAKNYTAQISDVMQNDILKTTGTVCSVSKVNTNIYSNGGIKYKNRHENIVKLKSFDSSIGEDTQKTIDAKSLLDNISKLQKADSVSELPSKENGYYWIKIDLTTEEKTLFITDEENYSFDLYYDISDKIIYVKDKYYDEFNTKNNKTKLTGYKADEQYQKLIEDLIK